MSVSGKQILNENYMLPVGMFVFQAILVSWATLVSGTILATVAAPVTPERVIGNRGMGELALWWWVGGGWWGD